MKKERKYKFTIGTLSVLLIMAVGFSAFQYFEDYSMGERAEREELLEAVIWEISQDGSGIDRNEIKGIQVLKAKSGVYPLNYDVAVNLSDGQQILYSWKDESKAEVWHSN